MKKKLLHASVLLLPLLLLTSCESQSISDTIQSTINNALPNLWVSLAQLGAFIVTVFIFFKFAYKPIKEKIKARNEYVSKNIKDSNDALNKANDLKAESEIKIKEAHKEANKIVEQASIQANIEANKIKEDAQKDIDKEMDNVKALLKEKEEYLERKSHDEIVSSALDASKEILGREFTHDDNDRLVDDFISKMKEENK